MNSRTRVGSHSLKPKVSDNRRRGRPGRRVRIGGLRASRRCGWSVWRLGRFFAAIPDSGSIRRHKGHCQQTPDNGRGRRLGRFFAAIPDNGSIGLFKGHRTETSTDQ
jgi:hypothetical protein